jgi:hypothetical protein
MAVVGLYRVDKRSRVITPLCKAKVRDLWIHFLQNVVAVDAPKVIVASVHCPITNMFPGHGMHGLRLDKSCSDRLILESYQDIIQFQV